MGSARFETVLDFAARECDVGIRCNGCGRSRTVPVEQIADVFGIACRVPEMVRRLRCAECGHRGVRLAPMIRLERRKKR